MTTCIKTAGGGTPNRTAIGPNVGHKNGVCGKKRTEVHLADESEINNLQDQIDSLMPPTTYAVGDRGPAGGWVFYVTDNGLHGLEAAPEDQAVNKRWYNGINTNTEAHGDGIGAGAMNTILIIANQGSDSNSYAAGLCANLVITHEGIDYGDWYLPSRYELNLMYWNLHLTGKGDFIDFTYWSSTEGFDVNAFFQDFSNGSQGAFVKFAAISVRAIRAF